MRLIALYQERIKTMFYRQTPNGRWRFIESYKDPLTGKKKEISITLNKNTAASRKEAAVLLREKMEASLAPQEDKIRLGELIKRFVEHQNTHHKASTALQDEMHLKSVERLIGTDVYVSKITTEKIRTAMGSAGKSATWYNQKLRHIKLLWRWAYHEGYIDSLAVIDRLERLPEPSNRQKVLTKYMESEDLALLLNDMSGNIEYRNLTKLLALSGIRIGEAIALTINDIDFDRKEIIVNKTYALNAKTVQSTKTETSDRIVHLRPELFQHVKNCVAHQKQLQLILGFRSNILFPWSDGDYLHYEAFAKYFREHTKKVLGKSLPVHSLRHTYTSLMAEAGVPIETISRQLGHSDSKITRDVYMHVTNKIREADNEKLDCVHFL